jgi:hypothetical protein
MIYNQRLFYSTFLPKLEPSLIYVKPIGGDAYGGYATHFQVREAIAISHYTLSP